MKKASRYHRLVIGVLFACFCVIEIKVFTFDRRRGIPVKFKILTNALHESKAVEPVVKTVEIQANKSAEEIEAKTCSPRNVQLSGKPLPITGLVSFPGSGNTWTRHLIQQMTGLGTSSCYCDGGLRSKGFPFECHGDKSKVIVVKTHENYHIDKFHFKKVILLIRNPYDALLSYANFAKGGHTGKPSKKVLLQTSNAMFNHSLRWFVNLTNRTIGNFKGPVHVLQYEKLKTDMYNTLWNLAKFLDVNVTESDIACTVKLQEGNFHRKTDEAEHLQLLKDVYNKDKLIKMKEAAEVTEKVLKKAYNVDIDVGTPIEQALLKDIDVNS